MRREIDLDIPTKPAILLLLIAVLLGLALRAGWLSGFRELLAATDNLSIAEPSAATEVARLAAAELYPLLPPGDLTRSLYTRRFLAEYRAAHPDLQRSVIQGAPEDLVGEPLLIWAGEGFVDLAFQARYGGRFTQAEVRLLRQGNGWLVDRYWPPSWAPFAAPNSGPLRGPLPEEARDAALAAALPLVKLAPPGDLPASLFTPDFLEGYGLLWPRLNITAPSIEEAQVAGEPFLLWGVPRTTTEPQPGDVLHAAVIVRADEAYYLLGLELVFTPEGWRIAQATSAPRPLPPEGDDS